MAALGAIEAIRLGRMPWDEALAVQEETHASVCAGGPERLLLVEHPPTVTLGRGTRPEHLVQSPGQLRARGYAVHETNRGGSATYHGPGQLVGYPIVSLRTRRLGLHAYVRVLEETLIEVLDAIGVEAFAREGLTGVWTTRGKIAAIGIAVRRGVSLHGFALNLDPDPPGFAGIVPCGLVGEAVASLAHHGVAATWDDAATHVEHAFRRAMLPPSPPR
jgi:lipoyl(octanoyl) transferase